MPEINKVTEKLALLTIIMVILIALNDLLSIYISLKQCIPLAERYP